MATYFVKVGGGVGSGLDDANAWSLAKLNSVTLSAGDIVQFKRGDAFYGTLTFNAGGTTGSPITYQAYSAGTNPILSGFTQLNSWTFLSGHTYYSTLSAATLPLNLVTLDGAIKPMGRYPTSGYLQYSAHTSTSISSSGTTSIPFNPTGAEAVIRKARWIIDRNPITSKSGVVINYSTDTNYGSNGLYDPVDLNGFFIQGHLSTLAQDGDWFYDNSAHRLYMYFASGPTGRTVNASTVDNNSYLNFWTNITFNNIDFVGANLSGSYNIGTSNIKFNNCNWRQQGGNGVYATTISGLTVSGGTITDSLNCGIWLEQLGFNTNISNVVVTNTGQIIGAGRSGDGAQEGIQINGDNTIISGCTVTNTGFNGISFFGGNCTISNNVVTTFTNVKDDGGGIYTYVGTNRAVSASSIINNIILSGIGVFSGISAFYYEPFGKSAGIYLDDYSNNITISGNSIAHGGWNGIFLHDSFNNIVANNLVYDWGVSQMSFIHDIPVIVTRNNIINSNTFVAKDATQTCLHMEVDNVADYVGYFGTFNSNIYARPIDDALTILVWNKYLVSTGVTMTLDSWKSAFSQDSFSTKSPIIIGNTANILFQSNSTSGKTNLSLGNLVYEDFNGNKVMGSLALQPLKAQILINTGNNVLIGPIVRGINANVNF